MNTALCSNWTGFAASIPGSGHIRRGLPCQDASAAVTSPRPMLIVCDGRGSAAASHDGAQAAVRAFQTQAAVFEPMLASILDTESTMNDQWQMFARIMYRTLMQVKLDLAAERGIPEKEFDFTVAFAIIGTQSIGCFQVGDGTIVLRQNGEAMTAFPPDKGEFANQTHFLRENGECLGKFHAAMFPSGENTGVAITSDGPQYLMFKMNEMKPGKIFEQMLDDLHNSNLCRQDIMDYLTRRDWENDPRGSDDRSIAILAPLAYPKAKQAKTVEKTAETGSEEAGEPAAVMAQTEEQPAKAPSKTVSTHIEESATTEPTAPKAPVNEGTQETTTASKVESNGTETLLPSKKQTRRRKKAVVPVLVATALAASATCAIHEHQESVAQSKSNAELQGEICKLQNAGAKKDQLNAQLRDEICQLQDSDVQKDHLNAQLWDEISLLREADAQKEQIIAELMRPASFAEASGEKEEQQQKTASSEEKQLMPTENTHEDDISAHEEAPQR